jgi:hypothetical protein
MGSVLNVLTGSVILVICLDKGEGRQRPSGHVYDVHGVNFTNWLQCSHDGEFH